MAKKIAVGTPLREQNLPGIEPEELPAGLEKAISTYHDRRASQAMAVAEHKKNVDDAFNAVKMKMHEHGISAVKLRIDGVWKRFRLLNNERGKFEKIKTNRDDKPSAMKVRPSK